VLSDACLAGYKFDNWRLDLDRGSLVCNEEDHQLRYQTFQVLLYFLQHPGVLITKDELTEAIWKDAYVSDNALVQCIAEIRRALEDDPKNPRFIKTIPKIGYRFLPAVIPCEKYSTPSLALEEIVEPSEDAEQNTVPAITLADRFEDQAPTSLLASNSFYIEGSTPIRFRNTLWIASLCVFLLVAAEVGIHWNSFGPRHVIATFVTQDRDNRPIVAVASFKNSTHQPNLDHLGDELANMLAFDLASSGHLNVLNNRQVTHLLANAGLSQTPDSATVAQIGRATHASDVVLGTLALENWKLHLKTEIRDGADGHLISIDDLDLPDASEQATQANTLSQRILYHLGVKKQLQPTLSELGTSNAEAYRYYSLGVEKAHSFQNAEAIDLLKKAVALDPKFAMAYARIGYTYAVADFVPQKGLPYLGRATQLSTGLPEKERLYIEAWCAVAKANYVRATQLFNHIVESYPEEAEAYYQLGRLLEGQEKSAEAVVVLKRGLEYHSDDNRLYNALGMSLMDLNQYGAALDAEQHYVALSPQDPNAHDSLGMSYQRAGNYDAAVSEYDIALSLNPEFEPSIVHLGDVAFEQGRYHEAVREYERYVQIAHSSDARAIGYGDIATVYRALGERSAAEKATENEMKNSPDAVWNALLLASDEKDAPKTARFEEILLQHLPNHERGLPPDLRTQLFYRAYLDLKRADLQLAIAEFKTALQHLPPSSAIDLHEDCLANAYLQSGMLNEAAAEYRRILQINPNYPLAEYYLGETYSRMGDQPKAKLAFAQFLHSWKEADQDLPEVVRAKIALATSSAAILVDPTSTATR
jgi:DNA-binding winged helix-turn-helix (wHTH) protein/Flp pilus assembly protein TadD/TolB-like protein